MTERELYLGTAAGGDPEPLFVGEKQAGEGFLVEGRTGGAKTALLMAAATQYVGWGYGVVVVSGKQVTPWHGYLVGHLGLDPQLVTLEAGRRTRTVPVVKLLYQATGSLWKTAEALAAVLVKTDDTSSHGNAHFFSSNVVVLDTGLEAVGPDAGLQELHRACANLVLNNRELKDGAHAVNALRVASRCPLFHPAPGVPELDLLDAVQPGGLALVVGDAKDETEHTKLLVRLVYVLVTASLKLLGRQPRVQTALFADDVAVAMQGGFLSGYFAQLRGSAAHWVAVQDAKLQAQSKHGSPGATAEAVARNLVKLSAAPDDARDVLWQSGERVEWDSSYSRTASSDGRTADAVRLAPRVTTRLTVDELLAAFAAPGRGVLLDSGASPVLFDVAYPSASPEEWDRWERAEWPRAEPLPEPAAPAPATEEAAPPAVSDEEALDTLAPRRGGKVKNKRRGGSHK